MKIFELLSEAYGPRVNKVSKNRSAAGEKLATLRGSIPGWLKAINDQMKTPITPEVVSAAREKIKSTPAYKSLIKLGFTDISTDGHSSRGSFNFKSPNGDKKTILVNGKIQNRTGYGGGEQAAPVPRIVPNDPEATVVKTMSASIAHLAQLLKSKNDKND